MDIDSRLQRLDERQEALVQAISGLADVIEVTNDTINELMKWLQTPTKGSDVSETISRLVDAIEVLAERVNDIPKQVVDELRQ